MVTTLSVVPVYPIRYCCTGYLFVSGKKVSLSHITKAGCPTGLEDERAWEKVRGEDSDVKSGWMI